MNRLIAVFCGFLLSAVSVSGYAADDNALKVTFDVQGKAIKAENVGGSTVVSSVENNSLEQFDIILGSRLVSYYQHQSDIARLLNIPLDTPPSPGAQNVVCEFGADRKVLTAMNEDDSPVKVMPGHKITMKGARLLDSQETLVGQWCCWKLVNGQWVCDPSFC